MQQLSSILVLALAAAAGAQLFDDFNIPDTTTIPGWTERAGDWEVQNQQLRSQAVTTFQHITFDASAGADDATITSEVSYPATGSATRYIGHVHRHTATSSMIMIKVQDNGGSGAFDMLFAYEQGAPPWSQIFSSGVTPFTAAILETEVTGPSVTVRIDNNMDTVWDETFTFTTAVAGPGDLGVCGYNDALLDNWTAVAPGLAGPAVLEVNTVDAAPTTVLQGEAGIMVTMSVDNTGQDRATSVAGALTFTGTADRTAEYTVTPDPANPTEILAGTTEVLQFTVDVSFSATMEVVTIDGGVTGLDAYAGGPVDDPDAAVTDSWEVLWACHATLCGDCNGDGQISIVDALTAAQHSAGLITLIGDDFTNCNVLGLLEPDPGAEVDILDALNLARSAAGLGVTLACC